MPLSDKFEQVTEVLVPLYQSFCTITYTKFVQRNSPFYDVRGAYCAAVTTAWIKSQRPQRSHGKTPHVFSYFRKKYEKGGSMSQEANRMARYVKRMEFVYDIYGEMDIEPASSQTVAETVRRKLRTYNITGGPLIKLKQASRETIGKCLQNEGIYYIAIHATQPKEWHHAVGFYHHSNGFSFFDPNAGEIAFTFKYTISDNYRRKFVISIISYLFKAFYPFQLAKTVHVIRFREPT